MTYPTNDAEFEDKIIKSVAKEGSSYSITFTDGWSMGLGEDCPIEPKAWQTARLYGRGLGAVVRGLFIDGHSVWSISMGGLGPGYEQCIQIVAAEVLRWLLANNPDLNSEWSKYDGEMMTAVSKITAPLGLSGAQWGAGVNLAANLYRNGPIGVMNDERVKDRHIQVSKNFPSLAA